MSCLISIMNCFHLPPHHSLRIYTTQQHNTTNSIPESLPSTIYLHPSKYNPHPKNIQAITTSHLPGQPELSLHHQTPNLPNTKPHAAVNLSLSSTLRTPIFFFVLSGIPICYTTHPPSTLSKHLFWSALQKAAVQPFCMGSLSRQI